MQLLFEDLSERTVTVMSSES